MADHANASHAPERRAPVLRVINCFLQTLQGSSRKKKTNLRRQRALDRLFEQAKNLDGKAFADFQRDIADETIAHDHVHISGEKISAFDIANKMHRALFQTRINLAREFIALDFLLADG